MSIARSPHISKQLGTVALPLLGDAKLLFQMFGNVISNALKYSADGSLIEVIAGMEGDNISVAVRDRGMGIPQDLANIFDRYNRGSNVSGIVGTGVGLYLVKIVAELHGGRVDVESAEDKGSCFTVRMPISPPEAPFSRFHPVPIPDANACNTSNLRWFWRFMQFHSVSPNLTPNCM